MTIAPQRLAMLVRPYRWGLLQSLGQVVLISGLELLKPWPLQLVIDHALGGEPLDLGGWNAALGFLTRSPSMLVLDACVALVLIHLASGGVLLLHNWTAIGLGQRMVNDLRGQIYAHLQRLSLAFHARQQVGDLMMRVNHDSFAVQTMVMNGLLPIISALILLAGMIVVLVQQDLRLTLVSIAIVPPLFVLVRLFNRRINDVATTARDRDTLVFSLIQWGMSAIKHVQAFTKEDEEHARFMAASDAALASALRLYSWQTLYTGAVNTLVAAGTALVIYVGAREVLTHNLSLGQLLVFTSYLAQLYAPINQITQSGGVMAGARVGVKRCLEVLDTASDLPDGNLVFPDAGPQHAIEWRNVAFRYRAETPVLRGIDLTITPGTTTALVGPTGAGKSTLLSFLPRFFDPSAGDVFVDGINLRRYQLKSLRKQVAMVLQPPIVFPLTLRDNIAYGRPDATETEIRQAARLASIDAMIEALPQGYDTLVGEGGATLSEGEKQRLTIARAVLRDAPILILDEPTSALDAETESLVMNAIQRLTVGRTTFVIAHRLSTVRNADRILVLKDGIIAESGSFVDLMQRSGHFAALYRFQFDPAEEKRIGA